VAFGLGSGAAPGRRARRRGPIGVCLRVSRGSDAAVRHLTFRNAEPVPFALMLYLSIAFPHLGPTGRVGGPTAPSRGHPAASRSGLSAVALLPSRARSALLITSPYVPWWGWRWLAHPAQSARLVFPLRWRCLSAILAKNSSRLAAAPWRVTTSQPRVQAPGSFVFPPTGVASPGARGGPAGSHAPCGLQTLRAPVCECPL